MIKSVQEKMELKSLQLSQDVVIDSGSNGMFLSVTNLFNDIDIDTIDLSSISGISNALSTILMRFGAK